MGKTKVGRFKKLILICLTAAFAVVCCGCDILGGLGGDSGSVTPAVYISQSVISLFEGDTLQLAAVSNNGEDVGFISDDDDVATVTLDGLITAVGEGETVISAATNSAVASCTVKVSKKPTVTPPPVDGEDYLVISINAIEVEVGKSVTLSAVTSSEETVVWTSSNSNFAAVKDGVVTGVKAGKATVTASVGTIKANCAVTVVDPPKTEPDGSEKDGYRLVWRDEFSGSSLDTSKWNYQTGTQDQYGSTTGPSYWGNSEHQYYTQDAVSVSDGALKITAKRQAMGDRAYTSGRILTRDKASWTYGYFEARMKTPTGNGMWPAFWMLPQPSSTANSNNEYGGWAANGEIDIMEAKGRLENKVDTTIHFGGEWPANTYLTRESTLSSNTDDWHTYAVEWTSGYIAWIVDGNQVYKLNNSSWYSTAAPENPSAPFDKPFYILLNLAVGGTYDRISEGVYAQPDGSFSEASMYVDYVRVYEKI